MSDNNCKLQLFDAQSGAISARLEFDNGRTVHLHSLVKPEDEGRYFEELEVWGDRIIFLGTGLGYHIEGIVKRIPSGSKIILIDYYDELVKLCKEKLFKEDSVAVLSSATNDNERAIKAFLRDGSFVQVIKHPASYKSNQSFYDELLRGASFGGSSKSSGTVMILHGKFFLQEETSRAVEQNNYKSVHFNYNEAGSSLNYESQLQCLIQKEKPDFILSINMLGFDGEGILGEVCWNSGIPLAVWFVDDPNPILLHQQQFLRKNMTAFCWERMYLQKLKAAGFNEAHYLPLATDPGMFSYSKSTGVLAKTGFVGSSMGKRFLDGIAGKFLWKQDLEPLIMQCAFKLLADPVQDVERILEEVCSQCMMEVPFTDKRNSTWLRSYIIHTASMQRRRGVVESLIPSGIETFGDPQGWRELCGGQLKTNPDIDYRTELARIYRGIEVNINITSCQMPSAVNQRVFDIPACGGFVISDMQDDLNEIFGSDELATYSSIEELREKVAFYLENEHEREGISRRARSRILNEHTYSNRIGTIKALLGF